MALTRSFASLREEDCSWDYRGEFTKRLTHGFHSYPAMMIPQVASRLIQNYSKPLDVVLDPFCGSGSVLVEAMAMGRRSWGVDLNPVALLVAKVKTTPIEASVLKQASLEVQERLASVRSEDVEIPNFFNLDYWFKPAVASRLAQVKQVIDSFAAEQQAAIKDFFLVAFSETVRLCSNSRSHEFKLFRYAEEKLVKHNPEPMGIFLERVARNAERMGEFARACRQQEDDGTWCRPLLADSTQPIVQIPDGSVDVVVTSPPYGDSRTTVAYGQFTRLSAQWLGFDDEQARGLDSSLMGGRPAVTLDHDLECPTLDRVLGEIAGIDPPRARQVLGFYADIHKALANIARAVRPGGYLCIVIGNRRVKKVQLPTDVIIAEMAAMMGLAPERIIVRNIPSKTMPLKNSPTNIAGELELTMHKEYIVVIRKDGASSCTLHVQIPHLLRVGLDEALARGDALAH